MPYNDVIKLDGFFFWQTFVQKYVLRRVSSLELSLSAAGHSEATSCVAAELRHHS